MRELYIFEINSVLKLFEYETGIFSHKIYNLQTKKIFPAPFKVFSNVVNVMKRLLRDLHMASLY